MKKLAMIGMILAMMSIVRQLDRSDAQQQPATSPNLQEPSKVTNEHGGLQGPLNFEIIIKNSTEEKLSGWTGQIFSIKDAKIVEVISADRPSKSLTVGNYVLMLQFKEEIPELKKARPFTFTITEGHKTTFTLVIGAEPEPEMEFDVDRHGSDYASFSLLEDRPEACLEKCKNDPKCKAYTFTKAGVAEKNAHCWLKHGIPKPSYSLGAVSGVVQRGEPSPYRVYLTPEKMENTE